MNLDDYTDEYILDKYEEYCEKNKYYESILCPLHRIEDDFGPDVQKFIYKNTDLPDKYSYYRINNFEKMKITWYTEEEAITEAKNTLKDHEKYFEEG